MTQSAYDRRNEADLLHHVQSLLDRGDVETALELLRTTPHRSKAMVNAYGVCLLRIGRIEEAISTFRKLVNCGAGFGIEPGTPTIFQTNYATALLLGRLVDGGVGVLSQIPDQQHAAVARLRDAVQNWKRTLSPFRRFLIPLIGWPVAAIPLAFPPGDLLIAEPDGRRRKAA